MTCPPGCVREKGHVGFHTTVPAIAKREDKPKPTPESIVREAFAYARRQEEIRERSGLVGPVDL